MSKILDIKRVIIDIFFVLFSYNIFHMLLKSRITTLKEDIYLNADSYFLSSFTNVGFMLFFLFFGMFFAFNYQKISWDKFSTNKNLLIFLVLVAFPIWWEQAFYDYNYFNDSDFIFDKVLLSVLFVLMYFHPMFIYIFLVVALVIWNSTTFPLDYLPGAHWIDVRPAYEILTLFISFMIVKSFRYFKDVDSKLFIFLALTLHASNYFVPGVAKIEISPNGWEWTFIDNINNLFVSSYINGWLGFLDQDIIMKIAQSLDKMDFVITISTMIIQLLAIFLLYNKRVSILFFILFEVLHFGIMFASGIFFWTWIIVNLSFLFYIKNASKETLSFLYNKKIFVLFIIIVLLSPLLYRPPVLAWWDANVNTVYDIFITTEDNKRKKLNSQDMSPYDTVFAQNNLSYIDKEATFINNYGFLLRDVNHYSNSFLFMLNRICGGCLDKDINRFTNDSYKLYSALENAHTLYEINQLLKTYGTYNFNEEKKKSLVMFLKRYFTNYNKEGKRDGFYKRFGAPYHLYDLSTKRVKDGMKVKNIEIIKYNTWYDKSERKIKYFDKKSILKIDIQ